MRFCMAMEKQLIEWGIMRHREDWYIKGVPTEVPMVQACLEHETDGCEEILAMEETAVAEWCRACTGQDGCIKGGLTEVPMLQACLGEVTS